MESLAEPEASAANARCTQRCRVISRRFAFFYVPLCASAVGLVVINAFDPPDKRRLTTHMPSILLVNPFTYWPLCVSIGVACTTFYFYSGEPARARRPFIRRTRATRFGLAGSVSRKIQWCVGGACSGLRHAVPVAVHAHELQVRDSQAHAAARRAARGGAA